MTPSSFDTRTDETGKIKNLELFLLGLRYKEGRLLTLEGNAPLALSDPTRAWIVYLGSAYVFANRTDEDGMEGARTHIFSGGVGQLLLGGNDAGDGFGLLASGTPGTRLIELSFDKLQAYAAELEYSDLIAALIDGWVAGLSQGLVGGVLPKDYVLVKHDQMLHLADSQVMTPRRDVVWALCDMGGLNLAGRPELAIVPHMPRIPIAGECWAIANGDTRVHAASTLDVLNDSDTLKHSLACFHRLVLHAVQTNVQRVVNTEVQRLNEKRQAERTTMQAAMHQLVSPLKAHRSTAAALQPNISEAGALLAACQMIGETMGVTLRTSKRLPAGASSRYVLRVIAQESQLQLREVALNGTWWLADSGPLLAYRLDDSDKAPQPVALLPQSGTHYTLVDPRTGERSAVTPSTATTLSPIAYMFYRPFPNRPLTQADVLRFGFRGNGGDMRAVVLIGLVIALLGLLPPLATGWAFNQLVPVGDVYTLIGVGLGLGCLAVIVAALQVARGIATLRVEAKFDAAVQAALWDRLLALPADFFRRYTAGDLGMRAMGISELRRVLSGHVISTLMNSLFSIVNLVLLFFYAPSLALVALALAAVAFGVTSAASVLIVRTQRAQQAIATKVSGIILQILTGVTKFRVAGAEHFAFGLWAKDFSELKRRYFQVRLVDNALGTFNGVFPLVSTLCIFAMLTLSRQTELTTGNFLAFNLAFTQFMSGWMQVGTVLAMALRVVPALEQIQPVLSAQPEVNERKADPGELSGSIEVSHVFFRYSDKTPFTLKDVSLTIRPGEFVALVGASGSGKSTLFRMLLGLTMPEAGGVYYDDQDLREVDVRHVRQQLGVVLQSAAVLPGDILSNIVGSWPNLTVDDAWEAARMAGLADDIEKMPMGMSTLISERGGNLSGGQRQRLLIARALVNRPRIILFDEATSALDNRTQNIVSGSLDNLKATRVVISHRLSTIVNADRIHVFDAGQIVQTGKYHELIRQPGVFADLARRQLI